MRFFKIGCNGADTKFLKPPYIVGRDTTPSTLWRPPILPSPPFFQTLSTCPPPPSLSHPTPHPQCSFCCPVSLTEWVILPHLMHCAFLLNTCMDNIDLHMSSISTLVPEGPWSVFYATRCQVYWGLAHNVSLLVPWFNITHINTQQTEGPHSVHPPPLHPS